MAATLGRDEDPPGEPTPVLGRGRARRRDGALPPPALAKPGGAAHAQAACRVVPALELGIRGLKPCPKARIHEGRVAPRLHRRRRSGYGSRRW